MCHNQIHSCSFVWLLLQLQLAWQQSHSQQSQAVWACHIRTNVASRLQLTLVITCALSCQLGCTHHAWVALINNRSVLPSGKRAKFTAWWDVPLTPNIPTPLVSGSDGVSFLTSNYTRIIRSHCLMLIISNTWHWSRHLRGDPLILTVPVSESAQLNTHTHTHTTCIV